jgi:hypothetical protein
MRKIMFRSCTLELSQVHATILEINERLRAIARERSIQLVAQRAEWYGFDPIHIRFDRLGPAWRQILAPWCDGEPPRTQPISIRRALFLRRLRPHYRRVFGIEQRKVQPAARLRDGSVISYF